MHFCYCFYPYVFIYAVYRNLSFFFSVVSYVFFFFFQAEDGIRDHCVTGVQTCALPIYLDPAALRGELHRVREQVPDDLLEPGRIADGWRRPSVEHFLEPDLFRLGGRPDGIERAVDHGVEIDRPDVEAHLPRDDTRDVEAVVDQLHLGVGIPENRVQRPLRPVLVEPPGPQHASPPVHGIEGRAELVREDRQELVLGPARLLRRSPRFLLLAQELLALGGGRDQGVRDVADFLNRGGGRLQLLSAPQGLSSGTKLADRLIDAARDP